MIKALLILGTLTACAPRELTYKHVDQVCGEDLNCLIIGSMCIDPVMIERYYPELVSQCAQVRKFIEESL